MVPSWPVCDDLSDSLVLFALALVDRPTTAEEQTSTRGPSRAQSTTQQYNRHYSPTWPRDPSSRASCVPGATRVGPTGWRNPTQVPAYTHLHTCTVLVLVLQTPRPSSRTLIRECYIKARQAASRRHQKGDVCGLVARDPRTCILRISVRLASA